MKKKNTLLMTILLAGVSWQHAWGQNINKHIDNAQNVSIDYLIPSDEYILSGNTFPNSIGGMSNVGAYGGPLSRIQLEQLDNNLNNQWFKTYATDDEVNAVRTGVCSHLDVYFQCGDTKQTKDKGFITCGSVRRDPETSGCPGPQYNHLFMLKTDAAGNVQWYKRYDRFGKLVSVIEMPNGNFLACGYEGELGITDVSLIICTDPNGNILWSRHSLTPAFWDHSINLSSAYYQVIPFKDNFALVGIEDYVGTVWGGTLVTIIDASGNYLQNAVIDNENWHYTIIGHSLVDAGDGDLVITGMGGNPCATGAQLMLLKVEPWSMTVKFHKVYTYNNVGDNSWGDAVKVLNGNTICLTGADPTDGGAVYAETDYWGNLLRYTVFNAPDAYDGKSMTINTALNVPVYSGTYYPSSAPTFVVRNNTGKDCAKDMPMPEFDPPYEIYDAKYEDPGVKDIDDKVTAFDLKPDEKIVCSGSDVPAIAKKKYTPAITSSANKFTITPNPASEFADISFGASFKGGKLEVYDVTGHMVISQELSADNLSFRMDVTTLLPGAYTVSLKETNGSIQHAQLIKGK